MITVGLHELTKAQAITLQVALSWFLIDLRKPGVRADLGPDLHKAYTARALEIVSLLNHEPGLAERDAVKRVDTHA